MDISIGDVKRDLYGASAVGKTHFVAQVFDEKYSASSRVFQILRGCGVGQAGMVEAGALVFHGEFDDSSQKGKVQLYVLVGIAFVAVSDGIVHRFRHGNHDVAVYIVVEFEAVFGVVDKTFYYPYVFWEGWNFNVDIVNHGWLFIS